MRKNELRRADFITSLIMILFAIWVIYKTFQMPMKDTYGGVINVWYVSPALFPLIIGSFILILSFFLLTNSIKEGGGLYFWETIKLSVQRYQGISENSIRFIALLIALFSFVYVNVPRVDFIITVFLFLTFLISIFFFDDSSLLKKLTLFYSVGTILFILSIITGISFQLSTYYVYWSDILNLIFSLFYILYCWYLVKKNTIWRKKLLVTVMVAILVPVFICPIFRYFLLVPLPYEGVMTEIMHIVYYQLK